MGSFDRRYVAAALAAVCLAGCGKSAGYWQDKLAADPLFQGANALSQSGSCAKLVPMEYGRTYPVPAPGGASYKVLYYPTVTSSGASVVVTPRYEGDFVMVSSAQDRCMALQPEGPLQELGPSLPRKYSPAGFYKSEFELYQALEKTAALYAKGGDVSGGDKDVLARFSDLFPRLAEPGLLPYYYGLDPAFWEWLRRQTGASIPKPA